MEYGILQWREYVLEVARSTPVVARSGGDQVKNVDTPLLLQWSRGEPDSSLRTSKIFDTLWDAQVVISYKFEETLDAITAKPAEPEWKQSCRSPSEGRTVLVRPRSDLMPKLPR